MQPWRKILKRERAEESHTSLRTHGRKTLFNYRMVFVTTLFLECGHTKVYRGDGVPEGKVRCPTCPMTAQAGKTTTADAG